MPGVCSPPRSLALLSVQCLYYNSVLLLAIAAGAVAVACDDEHGKPWASCWASASCPLHRLLPYVPMMRRMREWNFMVSYPADLAWLWKRVCEVIGAPDPLGIWLWLGLFFVGLGVVAGLAASRVWPWVRPTADQWRRRRNRSTTAATDGPQSPLFLIAVLFAAVALVVGVIGYAAFLRMLHYYTQPWYYITLVAFVACALDVLFGVWPGAAEPSDSPCALAERPAGRWACACCALRDCPIGKKCRSATRMWTCLPPGSGRLLPSGDVILVPRWECAIPLARYYRGPAEIITPSRLSTTTVSIATTSSCAR